MIGGMNRNSEERFVNAAGWTLLGLGALCLIPYSRRRLARRVRPILERVGEAGAGDVAASAAAAAVVKGGRRFLGL